MLIKNKTSVSPARFKWALPHIEIPWLQGKLMYSYWYMAFLYANCLCLLFQYGNFAESKTMTKMKAITSKLQQLHKLQQYKRIDTRTHRHTYYTFIYIYIHTHINKSWIYIQFNLRWWWLSCTIWLFTKGKSKHQSHF